MKINCKIETQREWPLKRCHDISHKFSLQPLNVGFVRMVCIVIRKIMKNIDSFQSSDHVVLMEEDVPEFSSSSN